MKNITSTLEIHAVEVLERGHKKIYRDKSYSIPRINASDEKGNYKLTNNKGQIQNVYFGEQDGYHIDRYDEIPFNKYFSLGKPLKMKKILTPFTD